MEQKKHQVCVKCIMDTTDTEIRFNDAGVCHYCQEAEAKLKTMVFTPEQEKRNLEEIALMLKKNASGKYDSILGVSGGVDSSYLMHLSHQLGLNPLIVH